jgi:hypothetical protein
MRSGVLGRFTNNDSQKIYFAILGFLDEFLLILES